MNFYLISTSHLETRIWFKDDEDFKAGMNFVAVLAARTGVRVIAFILMSNHVHFLLECCRTEAEDYINRFKKQYSYYYYCKYGENELLRRNLADIQEVGLTPESLERVVAYIQMNCVAARICLHPTGYRWGTGNTFFNDNPPQGTRVKEMSVRAVRRITHSTVNLPSGWKVAEDGYVLPDSYVSVDFVESLFRNPVRMNYFLNTSSKAKLVRESNGPSFRDQIIMAAIADICMSLFRKQSVESLLPSEQKELLMQVRRRFGADLNQICRVSGIAYSEAAKMLDSY
ncbi:MAG: hypothetical protein IK031_01080 [Bacteroidales bacterium]|nr:hypothetical protein [Bacteroidales bacterium]